MTHAEDDSARVLEGDAVSIDVLANDRNSDGDALAVSVLTKPSEGTAAVDHGSVTYVAPADWAGTTSFAYRAASRIDGAAASAAVTVTVVPVNHPPSFVAGSDQSVLEDRGVQSVVGWATQISPGAADESGQQVSFAVSEDAPKLFSVSPAVTPDGALSYAPAPNASGVAHVTVSAHDDGGTANGGSDTSAPQSFTVTVTPVNDAPSFVAGSSQTVLEDSGPQSVSGWSTQIADGPGESGQVLDFQTTGDTNPSLFSAAPAVDPGTGTLTFTAAPNAYGSATITLVLHDDGGTANGGSDTSAPQSFTILVAGLPTPQPDSFQGWIGSDVVGDLLANDTDPQGSPLTLDPTPASQPADGTVTLSSADGTFVYVPNAGFSGTDSFTYTVSNGYGATATAAVTINISGSTGVSTSLVTVANSKNSSPPYQVTTASFTPAPGATYLVFAGRVSSSGDIAILTTTGGLDVPVGPLDATVGADGATHGWVWAVHGLAGLPSTITVTFTRPNAKSVASDVLEVVQIGGSGVDHHTAQPGLVSSSAATLTLSSPNLGDSELGLLYVDGDVAGDPGWATSGIATLSGSVLHSPNGTSGFGALLAYAPQALASATTEGKLPAQDGNSYVSIAVDLAP